MEPEAYDRPVPQSAREIAFVKTVLNEAQVLSLKTGREYCGYIGLDADGEYVATPPKRGWKRHCKAKDVSRSLIKIASYRTHGTFAEDYEAERPHFKEIEADIYEGIDGYVATPGGRVWFLDGFHMTAKVICGEGCVKSDKNYKPQTELGEGLVYSVRDMQKFSSSLN